MSGRFYAWDGPLWRDGGRHRSGMNAAEIDPVPPIGTGEQHSRQGIPAPQSQPQSHGMRACQETAGALLHGNSG